MSKVTNKTIQERVARLKANGHDIEVNFQGLPPRPRINDSNNKDLSPRLTSTEMDVWLDGYTTGFEAAQ